MQELDKGLSISLTGPQAQQALDAFRRQIDSWRLVMPPAKTFVVSLVGGELQGYIVTPQAAAGGGYEATNSIFALESGTVLVLAACGLAAEQQCIAKPQAAI